MHDLLVEAACSFAGGIAGGALFSWRVLRSLRLLNFRMVDLENALITEVKKRAANGRWTKKEEVEDFMRTQAQATPGVVSFWEKMKTYNPGKQ